MLAVLTPGVVLAADTRDDVQVVDVAAAVGVAVALTVWNTRDTLFKIKSVFFFFFLPRCSSMFSQDFSDDGQKMKNDFYLDSV